MFITFICMLCNDVSNVVLYCGFVRLSVEIDIFITN